MMNKSLMSNAFYIAITFLIVTITFSFCLWLYLFLYFIIFVKRSSHFRMNIKHHLKKYPLVSIIVPARNEEENISNCLDSLLSQDYSNLEIIVVNDSSIDRTWDIIKEYQKRYPKIITSITSKIKPVDWIGKNWVCYLGYLKSTGQILMFIDADTILTQSSAISVAIAYQVEKKLECLTMRPSILLEGMWLKIIFPLLWIFSQIKYSSRRLNGDNKTGYLFGCFYLITRKAYEYIGTHKAVKHELIEDKALGEKIRQQKLNFEMLIGEYYVKTKISGNFASIWQGLKRSINLFPFQNGQLITCLFLIILLIEPIISIFMVMYMQFVKFSGYELILIQIFSIITLLSIITIYLLNTLKLLHYQFKKPLYTLTFPISCIIISIGFIFFIAKGKKGFDINWRERSYTITNKNMKK
jgi:chlorobactene glucosyltransferase